MKAPPGAAPSPGTGVVPRNLLVLGMGNDILGDDAIGLLVVRALRNHLPVEVEVQETSEAGLSLLDIVAGFDELVIVDAIHTGLAPTGFLHDIRDVDLRQLSSRSPHFLGIGEVLALGRALGIEVPNSVRIFGIEVQGFFEVGAALAVELRHSIPALTQRILEAFTQA